MSTRETNQKALYEVGMPIRRAVLGDDYVNNALARGSTEFARAMQEFTTAFCWGAIWDRPGLDRKQRSLINLSMLAATGKIHEFAVHTRGAVNNGLSKTEIREVLVQIVSIWVSRLGWRPSRLVRRCWRQWRRRVQIK
ncbi:AhpD-like protein [Aspergillus spectabilis]